MVKSSREPGENPDDEPSRWDTFARAFRGDDFVGTVVDRRYQITARIGAGGMGVVYRAQHLSLDRPVAVKVLHAALADVQTRFPKGASIRCRSSTNNEDLPGFSGAGLYDSFTHRPDEGHLGKSIRQVFASMWNFRAFEEREFYRVDHLQAAMGVVLHENQKAAKARSLARLDAALRPYGLAVVELGSTRRGSRLGSAGRARE